MVFSKRLSAISRFIFVLLVVAAIIVVGATSLVSLMLQSNKQTTSGSSSTNGTSISCSLAPSNSVLYIRVTSDNTNQPIQGADISATPVEVCNGVETTIAILYHPTLNASGIATLNASYITYYSLSVQYLNRNYTIRAEMHSSQTALIVLSVPSGKTNTTYG